VYNPDQEDNDEDGIGDACFRGDVNGDGVVNVLDVVATVRHILGIHTLESDAQHRADCNGDGEVNVVDVSGIVNVILRVSTCSP